MSNSKQPVVKLYDNAEEEDSAFQIIDEIYHDLEMDNDLDSELDEDSVLFLNQMEKELDETVDPDFDSAIEKITQVLRLEFMEERKREQARTRIVIKAKIGQLEREANQKLKAKLQRARGRDQKKINERERRLRGLFDKLKVLGEDLVKHKQQFAKSRALFDSKLMENDVLQRELRTISKTMVEQADALGETLIDEGLIDISLAKKETNT